MTDEYKPYDDWWKKVLSLLTFLSDLEFDVDNFGSNLLDKEIMPKSREEWMEMFLLWMEYKK